MDSQEAWVFELLDITPPVHTPEPRRISFWDHAAEFGDCSEPSVATCSSASTPAGPNSSPESGLRVEVPTAAVETGSPTEKLPTAAPAVVNLLSDDENMDASTSTKSSQTEEPRVNLFVGQTLAGALKILEKHRIPECIFNRTKRGLRVTAGQG